MHEATKALIEGYIQKADKKLEVACRLFKSGDYEDAISRAYYCAFHSAQALLLTEGQHADTHRGVITLFGFLFVKTGRFPKHLGKYLTNLKDDRETADYEAYTYIDEETAENALKEAEEFLVQTKRYLLRLGINVVSDMEN